MKKILLSVLALLAIAGSGMAQQWSFKAPMSVKRASAAATVCNGFIYVVGGTSPDSSETLHLNERFNPINNTWELLAPMPTPRVELGLVTINGKIYAIGGGNTSGALNKVEMYDPITNTWTTKSPMPTPRSTISVTVINNLIYCAGDWPNATGVFEVYNPSTDTWTTASPMLEGRLNTYSFCSANGLGYFIGGKNSVGAILSSGEVYNPANNTWIPMPGSLPEARWAGTCVELNGKIHYLGGSTVANYYAPTTSNFVFNLSNNQWTIGDTMNVARADFSSAVFNGKIYVFGGRNTNTQSMFNSVEEYSVFSGSCPDLSGSLLNGLVGYWPFCGNALDESGNGNHLTNNQVSFGPDRFGNSTSAGVFDGSNSFLRTEPVNSLKPKSFTVSAWFKRETQNTRGTVVALSPPTWQWSTPYKIFFEDENNTNYLTSRMWTPSTSWQDVSTLGNGIPSNTWINGIMTYDSTSGNHNFYVNNVLIGSRQSVLDYSSFPLEGFYIGATKESLTGDISDFFHGQIDDIGFWNRALSQQEITALYNATNCANNLSINPNSLNLNSGSTAGFTASTSDPNPVYNWQSDLGLGFQDLSNYGQYSGVDSNNLQVAGLQLRNHQQKFRVISTSGNCVDTSVVATIALNDTCINVVNDTNFITVTDTLRIIITAASGLVQNTLKAYPNPTAGMLFINTGNYAAIPGYSIRISSATGQEVFNSVVNQSILEVPLANLSPEGLFYLRLYDASGTLVTTRKIVLQ